MSRCLTGLFLLLSTLCVAADAVPPQAGQDHPIVVECHGKLRCGMVAIDGQTTGTTIMFDKVNWELNLPDDVSKKFAHAHHKEPVTIKGKLRKVVGGPRAVRWIVDVTQIQDPQPGAPSNCAMATICGKLMKQDGALVIACNDVVWPVDVSQDAKLKATSESLMTKMVILKGSVTRIAGADLPAKVKIDAKTIEPIPAVANAKR